MLIIGITGRKGAGKDTCAKYIQEYFATQEILAEIIPITYELKLEVARILHYVASSYDHPSIIPSKLKTLASIRKELNDPKTKEKYRLLMQWWGTEFRRNMYGQDYWINSFCDTLLQLEQLPQTQHKPKVVLVPDVRFRNEIDLITSMPQNCLLNIIRSHPYYDNGGDSHASENDIAGLGLGFFDHVIYNKGTKKDLKTYVVKLAQELIPLIDNWRINKRTKEK